MSCSLSFVNVLSLFQKLDACQVGKNYYVDFNKQSLLNITFDFWRNVDVRKGNDGSEEKVHVVFFLAPNKNVSLL